MDKQKIKQLAEELELVAQKYSSDADVSGLLKALKKLLSNAKTGSITDVIDVVPGEYYFQEGELSKYDDLEKAYSKFKMAIIYENKQYNDLKEWAEKRKKELFNKKEQQ